MLIGVLSDTHGRVDTTRAALEILRSRGVQYYIHCGDVGSQQVIDLLVGLPAAFVWGNCDHDPTGLQSYARIIGVQCFGAIGRVTLDGKVISFLHGDDHRRMDQLLRDQDCDLLFSGHTHVRGSVDVGRVRAINPGALHRATIKTVAVVDTTSRDAEFLVVE
jgi:putative phosphoesterase